MRGQPGRVRARRAAADAIWVGRVPVGVEPDPALGLMLPEAVQEPPDRDHVVVLARLDLRLGPVDRVNRRSPRGQSAENAVVDRAVGLGELVPVDVTGKGTVPPLGTLPGEGALHDGTSTTAEP